MILGSGIHGLEFRSMITGRGEKVVCADAGSWADGNGGSMEISSN